MREKTTHVLIHISADYTPKNNLQKIILKKMQDTDHVTIDGTDAARERLKIILNEAHNECNTRCRPMVLHEYVDSFEPDVVNVRIGSLLHIELLPIYIAQF